MTMANFNNQSNKTQTGKQARQQNAQSQGAFGTEFASETNAAEARRQNQQAQSRKSQNAGQFGQS